MEEKETKKTPKKTTKKTSTKKTTAAKTSTANKTTTKKTSTKKVTTTKKAATVKKAPAKEKIVKEPIAEKVEEKEPIIEREITEEELIERTVIIDGLTKQNLDEVVDNLENDNIILKNKVIKRSKAKKISIILLAMIIIAVVIAASIYSVKSEINKDKTESSLNSNIYDKVKEQQELDTTDDEEEPDLEEEYYDNIKNMTLKEFETKVLDGEDMNVLIFSSTCLACAQFEVTMQPILEELNVNLYKLDIITMTDTDRNTLSEYYSFSETPTIFTVRDGRIASELVGNKSSDDFKAWAEENLK